MVKLLENTFRSVNIGLANEMAQLCNFMKMDVWEVIEAAATKPFGFMPFYPGPGLGGHCIPVDPFYLSWKARADGTEARFIELAGLINGSMPHFVVQKIQAVLNDRAKAVKNSNIHVLGVAYKKDVDDVRESPALDVMTLLDKLGARVTFSDPHVASLRIGDRQFESRSALPACQEADCVVLLTDHSAFDYATIAQSSPLIVDTRNAFRAFEPRGQNVLSDDVLWTPARQEFPRGACRFAADPPPRRSRQDSRPGDRRNPPQLLDQEDAGHPCLRVSGRGAGPVIPEHETHPCSRGTSERGEQHVRNVDHSGNHHNLSQFVAGPQEQANDQGNNNRLPPSRRTPPS
jgi:hypothetical protein